MNLNNAYSPYGLRSTQITPPGLLGFNGQVFHNTVQGYALGNGHRVYNPRLMRFISPDAFSPFLKGGINAYGYCLNDPVNGHDPSGKNPFFGNTVKRASGLIKQVANRYKALTADEGLKNNQYWNMAEEMAYAKKQVKESSTLYRVITSKNGFDQLEPGWHHKFVQTTERKIVVFSSKDDDTMPSHGSLAEFSGLGFGTKGLGKTAIVAGYIIVGPDGKILFNHYSGHFQTPFQSLHELNDFLGTVGVEAHYIRIFGF
ncbi:RHS repeat-associated core domain-containing protein [Pseudomonas putida]|nr:RHS repeat-associated core domain-containing protein [Pseudomonas putida]